MVLPFLQSTCSFSSAKFLKNAQGDGRPLALDVLIQPSSRPAPYKFFKWFGITCTTLNGLRNMSQSLTSIRSLDSAEEDDLRPQFPSHRKHLLRMLNPFSSSFYEADNLTRIIYLLHKYFPWWTKEKILMCTFFFR